MMQEWDHAISRALFFGAKKSGGSRVVAILFARWFVVVLGLLAAIAVLSSLKRGVVLVLALAIGFTMNVFLGKLRTRKRPYTTHGYKALIPTWLLGGSFPSDHAMMAAVFGSVLILFGGWWIWVAPLLILGVMLGRVMVGVHYPSDVIAGSLIGCLSVFGAYLLIFL